MGQKNDTKEMKKQIEELLHMTAFYARMIVDENDDISEQDMRDFIAEKGIQRSIQRKRRKVHGNDICGAHEMCAP